jgi:acetyl esterase/lipase
MRLFLLQTPVTEQAMTVRVVPDIDYVAAAEYADSKDRLDLYLPAVRSGAPVPVIVSIHGGALTQGSKDQSEHVGRRFAEAGIATAVINYRLSPAVEHPAHAQDAAAAIAWVYENVAEYGGDPSRLFVIGHSAGAYLAALVALDPSYLAVHGMTPEDLRGVVPVSAFLDVEEVAPARPKVVWGEDPKRWREASVTRYARAQGPPLLLLYADGDDAWRRQQNDAIAAALERLGYPEVHVHQITGRTHITIWTEIARGDEVSDQIERFVSRLSGAD